MEKYFATISFNEVCSDDRTRFLTRLISNRLNRLLFKKHKHIKGYGSIDKTAQGKSHCHFLISVPPRYTQQFKLIFNDVCQSFNTRFEGWQELCLSEESASHYMNTHFKGEPIIF